MPRASKVGKEEIERLFEHVRERVYLYMYDQSRQECEDAELNNNTWKSNSEATGRADMDGK